MSDRLFGSIVIIVALVFIFSATQIQTGFMVDPVGPKKFPIIIGMVAAINALLVIIKPDSEPAWPSARTFGSILVAAVTLIGYAYALKPAGFIIPTAIAAGILSYQIKPQPFKAAVTGILLSICLFMLFKLALGLSLVGLPKSLTSLF